MGGVLFGIGFIFYFVGLPRVAGRSRYLQIFSSARAGILLSVFFAFLFFAIEIVDREVIPGTFSHLAGWKAQLIYVLFSGFFFYRACYSSTPSILRRGAALHTSEERDSPTEREAKRDFERLQTWPRRRKSANIFLGL